MITGLHVPICRMFNYDVERRRRLVTFYLYATDGRFVSSVLCTEDSKRVT